MLAFAARRLLLSVFVIFGTVTVIFIVIRLIPGDPIAVLLGPDATPEAAEALRQELGLDRPVYLQYLEFVGRALRFDFGDSLRFGQPATELVMERVPLTARLALVAMAIALVVSFPLGILAARRVNTILDRLVAGGSLLVQSFPTFWVGIMLILVFARELQILPSAGSGSWQHLILPAVTLALPFMAILIRLLRSGLLEVMGQEYVVTARAKGLRERRVIYVHAIKNTLIPVVTVVGLQFGAVLTGAVIVEEVFAWPGIGRLLVDAIGYRDYPVIQATILLISVTFVIINFAVDVLYGYLDPRARLEEAK